MWLHRIITRFYICKWQRYYASIAYIKSITDITGNEKAGHLLSATIYGGER